MGRVYDVETCRTCRAYGVNGKKLLNVFRVEFDTDADEGMATVHSFMPDGSGSVFVDFDTNEACRVSFRTYVRIRHRPNAPDEIDPIKRLGIDADGFPRRWDVPVVVGGQLLFP